MRRALSRAVPPPSGGEPRRRTLRLPRRPAQLMRLSSCPSPAPLGHSLPGAPPRTGTGDAVTPSCAGASRDRAALRVRVSDRDPGAPRPLPERWGGRVRGCPRGPWLPAGCGWGGARALDLGGPVALGLSLSSCKVAWMLISSGGFLVSPFERL